MSHLPRPPIKDISLLYTGLNPNLLPKVGLPHHQQKQKLSHISRTALDLQSPYYPKPNNNAFEFGLQVIKLSTQPRERTTIKTTRLGCPIPSKNISVSRVPTSIDKSQRVIDILEQWPKLPRLTPSLPKVLENKAKAYSQNEISITSRKGHRIKLEKIPLRTKKGSTEKRQDSVESIPDVKGEGIKAPVIEEPVKPVEVKSLNIVQKRLNQNKDSWFNFMESRNERKEVNTGGYLAKALTEVNTNVTGNIKLQGEAFKNPIEFTSQDSVRGKEKEKNRVDKIEKGGKVNKEDKEVHRDIEKRQGRSKGSALAREESQKEGVNPSTKGAKESKRKKEIEENLNKKVERSGIKAYKFEEDSDDDLNLYEYMQNKKDLTENVDNEEYVYK